MPVLMIAEQPNMDEATYASMLEPLMPLLRSTNRLHFSCRRSESRRRDAHHRDLGVRGGPAEVF